MKIHYFSVIYVFLIAGCSSYRNESEGNNPVPKDTPKVGKTAQITHSHRVIWELFGSNTVTLQLKNVDTGTTINLILQKGISQRKIPAGHWELTGFEEAGNSFVSMNTSKKFVFLMNSKVNTYAGSIITGCPKISPASFKLLKAMKFFNRYPFSSSTGLCELIVGNDFAGVSSSLRKAQKSNKLNLVLGF